MGDLLDKVYKGSYNAFNIVLRKDTPIIPVVLSEDLTAGAVTEIKVNYKTGLTCNLFADEGFLILTNEKKEQETVKYTAYTYDETTGIVTFTVDDTLTFDYSACLSAVDIDYGRIDCTDIDVQLVIKKELADSPLIDKTATKVKAEAGLFELILTTAETDIASGTYYYTIAEIANNEVMPFENDKFEIVIDCIN